MTITDTNTANTGASLGESMTSGTGTAKGTYVEAIASTSEETYWVHLSLKSNETDENFIVDISVGAAASEVVKIANIPTYVNISTGIMHVSMPLTIAVGSRVAVRCAATASSKVMEYSLALSNEAEAGKSTTNETIGISGQQGTDVDAGASDNTKGAYSQLVASTGNEYNYFIVFLGNSDNAGQTSQQFLVDIATGAPTEVVIVPNIIFFSSGFEIPSSSYNFWHTISASTEISARCQSSNTADANDRIIDVTIIGFAVTPPAGGGSGGALQLFNGQISS